ncbi:MAG TPA: WD40 repeat domain-containing protein [Streptosporangiaceae bacterium]|nr:WD40 repeat domain-containing protein [Streptosporangiaceae bacterium]
MEFAAVVRRVLAGHGRRVTGSGVQGLATDAGAAFEADLARLGEAAPLARLLLAALAWARGPGLGWEDIWVLLAQALATGSSAGDHQFSEDDVRWVQSKARAYLVTSRGPGGRPAYRLCDDLLATYLRGEPGPGAAKVQARITSALLRTVPAGPGGRDWPAAHPYLRAHLAEHAAAAGYPVLEPLLADMGFLATADPATLGPLLAIPDRGLREVGRVFQRARPLLGEDPRDNAAYLAEAALAVTGTAAPAPGVAPRYRTRLAAARPDDSLLTLTGHRGWVNGVAFAAVPGGRLMMASGGDDREVRLWDALTGGSWGGPLAGHTGWVGSVAFGTAPDGRLLLASAGGDDQTVRVWDPLAGTAHGEPLAGHTGWVFSVAFGAVQGDGGAGGGRLLLASASYDRTVRLWDPLAGAALGGPLTGHTDIVNSVAFGTVKGDGEAGGGRLLLASGSRDKTVRLWNPLTGESLGDPLTGHSGAVFWVAFGTAPDGRLLLASASWDQTVRVWDPLTGGLLHQLAGHTGWVNTAAFGTGPDGRLLLASASSDQTVRVWDPMSGVSAGAALEGHAGWVNAVAFGTGRDGRLLLASASDDQTVRVWDPVATAPDWHVRAGHTKWVDSVAFGTGPDGRLLLASASDAAVQVWDPCQGVPVGAPSSAHTDPVRSVAFGNFGDGRLLLASSGDDKSVRAWEPLAAPHAGGPLAVHGAAVRSVAFGTGPDGRLLLASAGHDKSIRVWDADTGAPVGEPLTGHLDCVDSVAFGTGPDGRLLLASGGGDQTVRVWDPLHGEPVGASLVGHGGPVRSVAFGTVKGNGEASEERLLLASASDDQTVRLWNPLTGEPIGEPLTGHTGWVGSLAFGTGPHGRALLASASGDRTVRVWDLMTRACTVTLRRRTTVHAVAMTGLVLAVGDDEGLSVLELDVPGR